MPKPRRMSANPSRNAKARARIASIRFGYCCHGPDLPHRLAFLASATENRPLIGSASPLRFTSQIATMASPSPSMRSLIHSQRPEPRTRPIAPSPQIVGRPFTTAIDCSAAIGVRPTSMPCMMATIAFSGVSRPFGAMPALQTAVAIRQAPSKSCGTMARTAPPD